VVAVFTVAETPSATQPTRLQRRSPPRSSGNLALSDDWNEF
jgi:hypothetical protein